MGNKLCECNRGGKKLSFVVDQWNKSIMFSDPPEGEAHLQELLIYRSSFTVLEWQVHAYVYFRGMHLLFASC
jgi:hypothetical protein